MISRDDIEAFEDMIMSEHTDKKFKGVDEDKTRMAEYKDRLRMSLVLEQYYKLLSDYPSMPKGDAIKLASDMIDNKE